MNSLWIWFANLNWAYRIQIQYGGGTEFLTLAAPEICPRFMASTLVLVTVVIFILHFLLRIINQCINDTKKLILKILINEEDNTYKGDSGGINHSTKHTDIIKLNIEHTMQRPAFRIQEKFYNEITQIKCSRLCTFCKCLSL